MKKFKKFLVGAGVALAIILAVCIITALLAVVAEYTVTISPLIGLEPGIVGAFLIALLFMIAMGVIYALD